MCFSFESLRCRGPRIDLLGLVSESFSIFFIVLDLHWLLISCGFV